MLKGILYFRHCHKIKSNVTKGEKSCILIVLCILFNTTSNDSSLKKIILIAVNTIKRSILDKDIKCKQTTESLLKYHFSCHF
jgi:hypothetical protein